MTPKTALVFSAVCKALDVVTVHAEDGYDRASVLARAVSMHVLRNFSDPKPSLFKLGTEFGRDYKNVIYALGRVADDTSDSTAEAIEVGKRELLRFQSQKSWQSKLRELVYVRRRLDALQSELNPEAAE